MIRMSVILYSVDLKPKLLAFRYVYTAIELLQKQV